MPMRKSAMLIVPVLCDSKDRQAVAAEAADDEDM
jgi:hypothetical protein